MIETVLGVIVALGGLAIAYELHDELFDNPRNSILNSPIVLGGLGMVLVGAWLWSTNLAILVTVGLAVVVIAGWFESVAEGRME